MTNGLTQLWSDIQTIASPLLVMLFGVIVLLADTGSTASRKRWLVPISLIGLVMAAVAALPMLVLPTFTPSENWPGIFAGGIVVDRMGGIFCIILCIIAALAIGMSPDALRERRLNDGEYYALILFATAGSMVMALSLDLVNLFVGLEVLSVALYILCGFLRRELRSEESAVKYFLLGAFGSGFLLYGIALIYGSVGIAAQATNTEAVSFTNLNVISQMLETTARLPQPLTNSPVFVAGIALLFVGLAFKASIVPFHWYAPDVYEGAPTGVTAFMSAGAKVGAFAAFLRVTQMLMSDPNGQAFRNMLWWLAVLTMVVGNALAIRQTNIKRMLAYSSIAHAGYILVGILASGIASGSIVSQSAIAYYLLAYTLMNLGAFAVVLWLGRDGGEYTEIKDYAGLAKKQPLAAATMSVLLLSLAGFPPVAGFFGKLYIFLSAIQSGEFLLATIGLVVSAIGVFYYLGVIATMYFKQPVQDFTTVRAGGARWVALIAAAASLILGLFGRLSTFSPNPATPKAPVVAHANAVSAAPTSPSISRPSAP